MKWNPRDLPNMRLWSEAGKRPITRPYPKWLRKLRAWLGGWEAS